MIKSSLKWCVFLFIGLSSPCVAQDFHTSRTWLNLLYYEKTGDTYKSLADDARFFVSPSGKTDPKEEYATSLRLTQEQDVLFRKTFPLRYKTIAQHNKLIYLPLVTPNADITTAQIAFPNRYMANPASMFGHLFIILKSKNGLMDSDILHYLADTAGKDDSAYIYNGLTGQFKGWFLREPYYKKIKEYNYVEDRDITYYDFDLSLAQLQNLQLHAIELQQSYFDYYFLDENCAFFTGKLLNVVLDTDIVSRSSLVFPSQIINALLAEGLLTGEYSREASTRLFSESFAHLHQDDQSAVIALLTQETNEVPTNTETLKTFLYISEYVINNQSQLAQIIRHNRIQAYAELSRQGNAKVRPTHTKKSVITPIKSNGLKVGYGLEQKTSLAYAPIYYSEYESFGELETKKLNLLASRLMLQPQKKALFELTLADIANLTRHNSVLNSYSWKLNSMMAYQNTLLTNQSIEIGQTHQVCDGGLTFAFLGLNYSNYDTFSEKEFELSLNPSLSIGMEAQILPGTCRTSAAYDYRFNRHYLTTKISFKILDIIQELTYIRSDNFEGLKVSATLIF